MKHVKLFEDLDNITDQQKRQIEKNSSTYYSRIMISKEGETVGSTTGTNHKLNDLAQDYTRETNGYVSLIIEHTRRILSDEEIEIIKSENKYNL